MHVVNISRYTFPDPPSRHTLNWAFWRHVRSRCDSLSLICQASDSEGYHRREDGIDVHAIPQRGSGIGTRLGFLSNARRTALGIAKRLPERPLLWASDDIFGNLVATSVAKRTNARFLLELQGSVFHRHDNVEASWKHRVRSRVIRSGIRRADRVRVCCEAHLEAANDQFGAGHTSVVPTRVNTRLFDPAGLDSSQLRRQYGLREDATLFVSVANLISGKGLHDFVDALGRQPGRPAYVIVGEGPMRTELQERAERLSVDLTLLGKLPHDQVREVLAAADVFALPSYREGMPRAVLEAQAMGLPVIASNVDGIPEQVGPGSAVLVEPGSVSQLSAAIEQLSCPSVRARMARSARSHTVEHHDERVVFDRWSNLLDSLAESHAASG